MLNNFNMRAFRETSDVQIIGHGNPDNNLESRYISFCIHKVTMRENS
jgi:hypothetical protein